MLMKCGFVVQCLSLASAVVLIEGHLQYSFDHITQIFNDANIEDRDALYPITRFAGMGYNLLRGNPEGDFERGGKDPGLRDTRWIFNLTYRMNKEGHYNGKTVQVPDQVEFQPSQTCASRSLTRAYSGQSSYQKELERNVKFDLSGGYMKLVNLGFSLSAGMKEVEKRTKDSQQVMIQETRICNLGNVRYKDELVVDNLDQEILSRGFKNAVKKLPDVFDNNKAELEYRNFIESWGTSVILSVEVGERWIARQSATYSEVYKYLSTKNNIGGSVNAGFGAFGGGASGGVGIDLKTINDNVNQRTKFGKSKTTLTIGTKDNPAPILLELLPIAEVLTKNMWGATFVEDGVALKQKNLKRALKLYPSQTSAQIKKDPPIIVHPKLTWLSGTFSLPMPKAGCSEGLSKGCVKQDTYNLVNPNLWSHGISSRLTVDVNKNYIVTCFCIKTEERLNSNEVIWPRGSYCIARKDDHCPQGFGEGFIKWDDKDINNKNAHKGVLPGGDYDSNTKIYFCCRNDGSSNKPVQMPTDMSFVLYRYGGQCQKVAGMSVQEDFIQWNDEFAFNRDETGGLYPDDDGSKKKHKLHYCHYSSHH